MAWLYQNTFGLRAAGFAEEHRQQSRMPARELRSDEVGTGRRAALTTGARYGEPRSVYVHRS